MAATNLQLAPQAASPPHAAGGTNSLHDIRPPVEIPTGWQAVISAVAALALVTLAWFAWRWWKNRAARIIQAPPEPAHVRARRRLIEALTFIGQSREFCIVVSDTIRAYLEERFAFHAPDRTTEEFLYELQGTDLLMPDQKQSLGAFLERCDLVKFARYEPGEPELRELHDSALRLVTETEPLPEPQPGAAVAAEPG